MEQKTGWFVIRPSNDDIINSGVKGQRKGHRRYQNKDGSLTPLGRIHYGYGQGRKSKKDDDDDQAYSGTVEGEGKSKGGSSSGSSRRTYTDANPRDYRPADDNDTSSTNGSSRRSNSSSDDDDNRTYSGTVEGEGRSSRSQSGSSSNRNRGYTDANPRDYRPAGDNDTSSTNGPSRSERRAERREARQQVRQERAAAQETARQAREQEAIKRNANTAKKLGDVKKLTDVSSSFLEGSIKRAEERAKAKLDVSNLSNEEMQAYITRQALESKYKNLVVDGNVARGRQRLDSILKTTGSILAVGVSAATLAKTIHELRK